MHVFMVNLIEIACIVHAWNHRVHLFRNGHDNATSVRRDALGLQPVPKGVAVRSTVNRFSRVIVVALQEHELSHQLKRVGDLVGWVVSTRQIPCGGRSDTRNFGQYTSQRGTQEISEGIVGNAGFLGVISVGRHASVGGG